MFAKLLKHEWKATAGPLGLLTLGAAGIAVFGALVLRTLLHLIESDALIGAANLLLIPMGLLVVFSFLAIGLYALGVSLLLLVRFYKSRFSDQGYLTFTLPAKPSHIHKLLLPPLKYMNTIYSGISATRIRVIFVAVVIVYSSTTNPDRSPSINPSISTVTKVPSDKSSSEASQTRPSISGESAKVRP